ncbi:MAG: cell division protein ZipA C-terminal FtsZ-binding domain-containing protein [Betaproteobacteria bacterium]
MKRAADRAFAARHADVLLEEAPGRREPTLGRALSAPQGSDPHPQVDYVIALAAPAAIAAPVLRELWASIELRFARRTLLAPDGKASLRAALQMVSRDGVVSDAELLEFRSAVETLAAKLGASVAAPEMREALEQARQLDRACADADIQVALHVVGVQYVKGSLPEAQAFGIEPRPDGVTLSVDVATTPEPRRAYEAMARAAVQLAAAGGGRVVDDNGAALDERALATIGAQVDAVGAVLAERGIEPGSPLALRLFS